MATNDKHEHRRATYREGADRVVVRCSGCFEELQEVEGETLGAPQPQPVPGPEDEGGKKSK